MEILDSYLPILTAVIKGERHKHYKHVTELADLYYKYMTGLDQGELIVSLKKRETEAQKEQRIHITNSRTRYVCNKVYSTFDQVERADDIVEDVSFLGVDGDADGVAGFKSILQYFYDKKSLREYLFEVVQYYQFYDPNAFLAIDFEMREDGIFIFPVEIPSVEAIDYKIEHGDIKYLIREVAHDVCDKMNGDSKVYTSGKRFILYAPDYQIEVKQRGEYDDYDVDAVESITIDDDDYDIILWNTLSKYTPVVSLGYIKDPETCRETYVSPLYPAEEPIKDLINTKSEYDLSRALHGFIQKYAMAMACDFREEQGDMNVWCRGGTLNTGASCTQCKGTGLMLHKSVQDVILVKAPDGKEEHIPLDQMVHYVEIPQHIIDRQKEDLEDLEKDVSLAIFNTNVFDDSEYMDSPTATEINSKWTSVYNVLNKYGNNVARVYRNIVHQLAVYKDMPEEDLSVTFKIPSDFAMESLSELIDIRKRAVDSGATYETIRLLDLKILKKQSQDDPDRLLWAKVKDEHKPFADKGVNERIAIVSGLPDTDRMKTLYTYFDQIMTQVMYENQRFHKLPYEERKKIVDVILDDYMPDVVTLPGMRESFDEITEPYE